MSILEVIDKHSPLIAILVAIIGFFLTIRKLKADHDWKRREFTANMIADWNQKTSSHRKEIERLMPGLIDKIERKEEITKITQSKAREIYESLPDKDGTNWKLRFHFLELLNYFEYISSVYLNRVADKKMVEESFKTTLIQWNRILNHFIEEVKTHREYQNKKPWGPYHEVIKLWSLPDEIFRQETDRILKKK
ncbi:MAG: DUF4760 domain-containing protein [Ekhidna sp.]|nr:DUF4760 domain-containing protein [Ekhidna sp.]